MRDDLTLAQDAAEGRENVGRKLFIGMNVLEAARRRVAWTFDKFERVVVSVSGGKDSTITFELAHAEAMRRGREIYVFFLDQEAEYAASVEIVEGMMARPGVVPCWFQVPLRMTNATSYADEFFHAWQPGVEWMRPRHPLAITEVEAEAPDRFYPFISWVQEQFGEGTAFLVGLRADEALNRFRAVTRNPAVPGVPWTSRAGGGAVSVYPIYDWAVDDVWVFMARFGVRYNRIYDFMYAKQFGVNEMRVSFLLHEHSFNAMATLQEFEHETYDALVRRIRGAHLASIYAGEKQVLAAEKLPEAFKTWREFRDFLLGEVPEHRRARFAERFADQRDAPGVHRQQVRQLLINDWENNVPVVAVAEREDTRRKWMEIL